MCWARQNVPLVATCHGIIAPRIPYCHKLDIWCRRKRQFRQPKCVGNNIERDLPAKIFWTNQEQWWNSSTRRKPLHVRRFSRTSLKLLVKWRLSVPCCYGYGWLTIHLPIKFTCIYFSGKDPKNNISPQRKAKPRNGFSFSWKIARIRLWGQPSRIGEENEKFPAFWSDRDWE